MPRRKLSPRELIEPHPGDKRYIRRDEKGRIATSVDLNRSLSADDRRKAKNGGGVDRPEAVCSQARGAEPPPSRWGSKGGALGPPIPTISTITTEVGTTRSVHVCGWYRNSAVPLYLC